MFIIDNNINAGQYDGQNVAPEKTLDIQDNSEQQMAYVEGIRKLGYTFTVPEGYDMTTSGVVKVSEKGPKQLVCCNPLIIKRRVCSIDNATEKLMISFYRDGYWHDKICERMMLSSKSKILELANVGLMINSENAGAIVRWLTACEQANLRDIPIVSATSSFGWVDETHHLPYAKGNYLMDVDQSMAHLYGGYKIKGSMQSWVDTMLSYRRSSVVRFMMAASFAAPLIKILGIRSMVLMIWGDSRTGKTATLKAAMSIWGDPEALMVTFNSTYVAMERMAAAFCDLPIAVDERQLANGGKDSLEQLVYMIGSGKGRVRGSKTGGLQSTASWRTLALITGEEPITTDTSMTGVKSRVLEIKSSPFANENDASELHRLSGKNFGVAGKVFIQHLVDSDRDALVSEYEEIERELVPYSRGIAGSYVSCIAMIVLADRLANRWIYNVSEDEISFQMGKEILEMQKSKEEIDVNAKAVAYISDWIASNVAHFDVPESSPIERYGCTKDGVVYILPAKLDEVLSKAGYNPTKTRTYMVEKKLVEISIQRANGRVKKNSTVQHRFEGQNKRMVGFKHACYLQNLEANEKFAQMGPDAFPFS